MHNLMICTNDPHRYQQQIEALELPGMELTDDPRLATILLADPPAVANRLEDFPRLQWLQSTYAGIDTLTAPGLRRDYLLTNVRGCFGQLISEYVLGNMLALTRHLRDYHQLQMQHRWSPKPYRSLAGLTMLILGTGSIGNQLATAARALGLRSVGVNRSGQSSNAGGFDDIAKIDMLDRWLPFADIVVSTLPATPKTDDLLNAERLGLCQGALLFNVGRGNALCEEGLLQALASGAIHHAFLDVFKQEPLPQEHPFWQHPQITVTPHIAAVSFPEDVVDIFADNYSLLANNKPLRYLIDFNQGY
ncbi:2-ketoacid reductase [Photobacterium aquae]|uniref:2-ketoacid reductase n=1 Tax=Photobacterium aquae TaxID=1195763 RepID=A0A0J1H4D2_9GAMM|nr:D-2-hydroxyacid dehydrogenase [Photobacterium aquae]KLV06648.1 2-ketoacid reductase [Photobacterium aquae]